MSRPLSRGVSYSRLGPQEEFLMHGGVRGGIARRNGTEKRGMGAAIGGWASTARRAALRMGSKKRHKKLSKRAMEC